MPTGRRDIRRAATEVAKSLPSGRTGELKWTRPLRQWLHLMVMEGLTVEQAAERSGLRLKRARSLCSHPEIRKAYDQALVVLRENEKARNIHKAIAIRDNAALTTAAGQRVQLDAAKFLHGEDGGGSPGARGNRVSIGVQIGYVIDLTGDKAAPRAGGATSIDVTLSDDDGTSA